MFCAGNTVTTLPNSTKKIAMSAINLPGNREKRNLQNQNAQGDQMFSAFQDFLRDESGNATIESLVVICGSVWMAGVVITDISYATMSVGSKIQDRLEYTSIVAEIMNDYGPDSGSGGDSGSDSGSGEDDCAGNPGNNKCVGNAGENPNGKGGWGSGDKGRSR